MVDTGPKYVRLSDGSKFKGQLLDTLRHGHGTCAYRSGDCYQGTWLFNARHGTGTFSKADGSFLYQGEWLNDHANG